MLPVNEKSTGTADVIHNEALTKHTYHEKGYIKNKQMHAVIFR